MRLPHGRESRNSLCVVLRAQWIIALSDQLQDQVIPMQFPGHEVYGHVRRSCAVFSIVNLEDCRESRNSSYRPLDYNNQRFQRILTASNFQSAISRSSIRIQKYAWWKSMLIKGYFKPCTYSASRKWGAARSGDRCHRFHLECWANDAGDRFVLLVMYHRQRYSGSSHSVETHPAKDLKWLHHGVIMRLWEGDSIRIGVRWGCFGNQFM